MSAARATSPIPPTRNAQEAGAEEEDERELVPVEWDDMPAYVEKMEKEIVELMGGQYLTEEDDEKIGPAKRKQIMQTVATVGEVIVSHTTQNRYFPASRFLVSAMHEVAVANQYNTPIILSRVNQEDERILHHWMLFPPSHPRYKYHLEMREKQEAAEKAAIEAHGEKIRAESTARKERAAVEKRGALKGPKEDGGEVDQLAEDRDEEVVADTLQLTKRKGKGREVPQRPQADEEEAPSAENPPASEQGGGDVDAEEEEDEGKSKGILKNKPNPAQPKKKAKLTRNIRDGWVMPTNINSRRPELTRPSEWPCTTCKGNIVCTMSVAKGSSAKGKGGKVKRSACDYCFFKKRRCVPIDPDAPALVADAEDGDSERADEEEERGRRRGRSPPGERRQRNEGGAAGPSGTRKSSRARRTPSRGPETITKQPEPSRARSRSRGPVPPPKRARSKSVSRAPSPPTKRPRARSKTPAAGPSAGAQSKQDSRPPNAQAQSPAPEIQRFWAVAPGTGELQDRPVMLTTPGQLAAQVDALVTSNRALTNQLAAMERGNQRLLERIETMENVCDSLKAMMVVHGLYVAPPHLSQLRHERAPSSQVPPQAGPSQQPGLQSLAVQHSEVGPSAASVVGEESIAGAQPAGQAPMELLPDSIPAATEQEQPAEGEGTGAEPTAAPRGRETEREESTSQGFCEPQTDITMGNVQPDCTPAADLSTPRNEVAPPQTESGEDVTMEDSSHSAIQHAPDTQQAAQAGESSAPPTALNPASPAIGGSPALAAPHTATPAGLGDGPSDGSNTSGEPQDQVAPSVDGAGAPSVMNGEDPVATPSTDGTGGANLLIEEGTSQQGAETQPALQAENGAGAMDTSS